MSLTCEAAREQAAGFVLGALDPNEEREVRAHLATCDQLHREFAVLGGVAQYLDETVELIEPPARLRQRVFAAVAAAPQVEGRLSPAASMAIEAARGSGPARATTTAAPRRAEATLDRRADFRPVGVAAAPRRRSLAAWLMAAGAVALIVALGGWNLYLQYQMGATASFDTAMNDVLTMAAKPGSMTAVLSADGGNGPRGMAAVGNDGSVALAMRDLQPTVGTQVYEMWVIPPNGVPVAMGSFRVGSSGIAALTAHAGAHTPGMTIALTLEGAAGATTPTMPVVSKGVALGPTS
jgi:anti-sigma-K factor RskA